jgi:hypothetical protein
MKTTKYLLPLLFLLAAGPMLRAETFTGLNVSIPLAFSGSFGWMIGDTADGSAPSLEIEAGIGGYKLMAGLHQTGGTLATAIKASYLYTWFEPIGLDAQQSYMGLELEAGLGSLVGTLGGYRRIDGDDDPWIASLGLGIRF